MKHTLQLQLVLSAGSTHKENKQTNKIKDGKATTHLSEDNV